MVKEEGERVMVNFFLKKILWGGVSLITSKNKSIISISLDNIR